MQQSMGVFALQPQVWAQQIGRAVGAALLGLFLLTLSSGMGPVAHALTTEATHAIVIDIETNTVLYEKNPDARMVPSSMTKVMTAYVVFNEVKAGRVDLHDRFPTPNAAYRRGGSSMFLLQNERASVIDLLYGLIVTSGNDAAISLAHGVSGSEEAFAELMNQTAQAIGMTGSNFVNASGWPDDNHYSTARDIAYLSMRLISDHPDFYSIFSEREFSHNAVEQLNRNPLLGEDFSDLGDGSIFADGIKTGTTTAGGHGLVGSAQSGDGRRILLVMNGMDSKRERADETARVMRWAFTSFDNYSVFQPGQTVGYAPVWLGQDEMVPLQVTQSVRMTLAPTTFDNLRATLNFDSPVAAPVYLGQQVGEIHLVGPGIEPMRLPVVAGESIDSIGRFQQVLTGLQHSMFGQEQ